MAAAADKSTPFTRAVDACLRGSLEVVQDLVVRNRLATQTDALGATLLHWAAQGGSPEVIAFLISSGSNVNAQDSKGDTALHNAAFRDNLDAVRTLLQAGARQDVSYRLSETCVTLIHFRVLVRPKNSFKTSKSSSHAISLTLRI